MQNFFMKNRAFGSYTNKLIAKKIVSYKEAYILHQIFSTSFHFADNKTRYSNMTVSRLADALNISTSHTYKCLNKLLDAQLIKRRIFFGKKEYKSIESFQKKHPKIQKSLLDIRYEIAKTSELKECFKQTKSDVLEDE